MMIGFIGFGEAASSIAKGLTSEGLPGISAFDVMAGDAEFGPRIRRRADDANVELAPSLSDLIERCDYVLCATSAKVAVQIAREAVPHLTLRHVYVDINAASPMVKQEIGELLNGIDVPFADVAVMESVPKFGHKVPMLVSGSGATKWAEFARMHNMDVTKVGDVAGQASAIKMARSSFMKGMTMLLFETLQLAARYDATDLILDGLQKTLTETPLEETANLLMTRTIPHAARRVSEMQEVQNTLQSLGFDDTMAEASRTKLALIAHSGLREYFHLETPKQFTDVLTAMEALAHSKDNAHNEQR